MNEIEVESSLRRFRSEMGLTQTELADLAGVTRQTIGLIEADKYNPSIKLCLLLGEILGKRLDDLFRIREDV